MKTGVQTAWQFGQFSIPVDMKLVGLCRDKNGHGHVDSTGIICKNV